MAPAQAALHRARPPLLRRRSRRPRHCWMAPAQVAFHRPRPPLLRRRSRRPRHCWMAPAQAALHRARPPLLRRRSSRPAPWWMAPMRALRARRSPLRRRSALGVSPGGGPSGASDGAGRGLAAGFSALRRRSPLRRRSRFGVSPGGPSGASAWWMAPMRALVCRARRSPLRRRSGHLACPLAADRAARQMEQRAGPRRLASLHVQACRARRSPLRRRSRYSACPLTADRAAPQLEQRRTGPANLFTAATNPRRGATFRRRSGATSGYATEDAAVIAIRSPGGAAPLPICCRSTTCCQSPRAVDRSRPTSISNAEPGVMRSCET